MSSKPIYVPYFYIIEHTPTGKRYAGCRYAKGCHPSEFMQPGGYQTSSKVVHKIIEEEGIDAFRVISIKTKDEIGDVHDYETNFLVENDCATSSEWLNLNNNTSITPYGTDAFRAAMTNIYGVDHPSKSQELLDKKVENYRNKTGYDNPTQNPEVKEKSRQSYFDKTGYTNPSQNPDVQQTKAENMLERTGYKNPMQNPEVKQKFQQGCRRNLGVDWPMQSESVREKFRLNSLQNYGVDNPMHTESAKEKAKQTLRERYGVDNYFKSDECQERRKQKFMETLGVTHPMQTEAVKEKMRRFKLAEAETKITNEILQGNFSRFEYLWDTVDEVFLMGVLKSLDAVIKGRYVTIRAHNANKYIDTKTGIIYRINPSRFSMPLPENLVPYSTRKKP